MLLRCCCRSNTTETFFCNQFLNVFLLKSKSYFFPLLAPNYNQAQSVLGRLSTNKVLVSRFDDSNLACCTDEQKVFLKCLTFYKPNNINLNQSIVLLKRITNMIVGRNSNYSNILQQNLFWSKETFGMSVPSACVCVCFPFYKTVLAWATLIIRLGLFRLNVKSNLGHRSWVSMTCEYCLRFMGIL